MGPPRNAPIRVNGMAYSRSLNAVFRVVEFYGNGRIRRKDPYNARRRTLLDPNGLVSVPVDNVAENRDLRDQIQRLRCSRDAHERDLYDASEQLDKLKTRVSELNQLLEDSRTANRLLSAEVVNLQKKVAEAPQGP